MHRVLFRRTKFSGEHSEAAGTREDIGVAHASSSHDELRRRACGGRAGEMVVAIGTEFQKEILFALGGGDSRISIAILDGPVDRTHDCFRGARLVPLDTPAVARSGDGATTAQGTHIASLIFGQPCSSVEGVAPLCRGLIAPIFRGDRLGASQADLAQAIGTALDHGAHVILVSGGMLEGRQPTDELIAAVKRCNERNVLIVAGGARDGCGSLLRRSGATRLFPVGAIDRRGRLIGGSDPSLHELGIVVPGAAVLGAELEGHIGERRGANYAAALIAGVAGLLLGAQTLRGLPPDPGAVGEAMLSSATPRLADRNSECQRAWIGRANIEAAAARLKVLQETTTASPFGMWHRAQTTSLWSDHAAFRPRA
ncbi:S8 family serine peptidase [Rhodopseudomonas sp. HC1]|uniref:S8 family serine peptidase n=1 Tax=Rhodopseudomonas infernalis TaxID=2897386 RepID=UPI001EE7B26D|nr:S8 family serine peptidase [Rhodopseudomonas infernalis]MCG6207733.1 S8 family serine peptidase [Rhodopseudomonas infernalis]